MADDKQHLDELWSAIEQRMGVCPSFFKLAAPEPVVAHALFHLAKIAYLDNPLPSAFKEKLFTYLSRFCSVRYCVARHAAFLTGRGHIAGDPNSPALAPEDVAAIISMPQPDDDQLPEILEELQVSAPLEDWPIFESPTGTLIRIACARIYLEPQSAAGWTEALRRILGPQRYEQLALFIAFVRMAHFWTEVHPELRLEEDVEALLAEHEPLARSLLDDDGLARAPIGKALQQELRELRHTAKLAGALRESEARLKAIVERVPVGLGIGDRSGRIFSLNPAGLAIHGMASQEEMPGNFEQYCDSFQFSYPDGRVMPPEQGPIARAMRGEYVSDCELLLKRRSGEGEPRIVSCTSVPTETPAGVEGTVFVMLDVTQRKQAEEELRRSSERLRRSQETFFYLVQNSPFGILIVGADFRLRQVSAGAQDVFTNVRPLLGRDFAEILRVVWPEPFASEAISRFRHTLDTGEPFHSPATIEKRADTEEIGAFDWRVERLTLPDGEYGVVCHFYDLTEQQRTELALRVSEERLRWAAEAAHFGVFEMDFKNSEVYWSAEAKTIFGVAEDDPIPLTAERVPDFVYVEDRERVARKIDAAIDPRGDGRLEDEHRIILPDGRTKWVRVQGMTRFGGEGSERKAIQASGTIFDITGRKKLEEELRRVAGDLSEANRRKDEFLAVLAHELRNPLAPIRTGLEVMKALSDDPAKMAEVRDTMERQTNLIIALVDDLLDISRITRGKLELRKARINLSDVIHSAVESSQPLIDAAGHRLAVRLDSDGIELHADPYRLGQVLSNLINNAVKYTPFGGEIQIASERRADDVLISVRDTGIGIPAGMLERVFEMFAQIDRPEEQGYQGLGIGLTLVKTLVEMHGGDVAVSSAGPNKGTEFRVRLPIDLTEADPDSKAVEKKEERPSTTARKVLIVDDNQAAAEMLSIVVKMLGNEVRTAGDGIEAVRLAAEFLPEVVLMDIGMPGMDGLAAAERIRGEAWGRKMKLVALTGWGQEADKLRSKQAGFDDHLVKPVEAAELERVFGACGS